MIAAAIVLGVLSIAGSVYSILTTRKMARWRKATLPPDDGPMP
jgi:hypothetical protein